MMDDQRYLEFNLIAERYAMEKCGFCGADDYILTKNKKFAELILQECVIVCLEQRDPDTLNYKPSVKTADAVKRHFGVV